MREMGAERGREREGERVGWEDGIIVEVQVSVGALQILGEAIDNFCSQTSLNSVSLLTCVDLESRHIQLPVGGFCSGPQIDTSLYQYEWHVLLQQGPPFERNHGLVNADVPTRLIDICYSIGQELSY